MEWMGIHLDVEANRANAQIISAKHSPTTVFIIPTNEELMIAEHTVRTAGVTG
jgi:acetate kinase